MKYLQAADPYMIFRMSQHIALEGALPQVDFSRYFPYSTPTYIMNQGDYLIPAYLWDAGAGLFFDSYLEWGQFYPALMGAITTIPMYFFGKELFSKETGLSAAFFLAVISGALRRTSAGFFEKEPVGTFLMMLSLAFFARAWKRTSWKEGILSGISLGLFTISWGGVDIMYYVYPMIITPVLFLNEDIRSMIAAYTPTILLGTFIGAIINPSRFWFTENLFLINISILGLLWFRHLVEEFQITKEKYLPYLIPSTGVLGGIMVILSPLYSDFIANKAIGLFLRVFGSGGGVIGGTVQENAPPGASSLLSSLNTVAFNGVPGLNLGAMSTGAWTLMMIGFPLIITSIILMIGKKYSVLPEKIPGRKKIAYNHVMIISWLVFISALLQNSTFIGLFGAAVISSSLLAVVYFVEENSAFTISTMSLGAAAAALVAYGIRFSGGLTTATSLLVLLPVILALAATAVLYNFRYFPEWEIKGKAWYLFIPGAWGLTLIYGGTTRSRLVFFSTFAIALAAGYALSRAIKTMKELDFSRFDSTVNPQNLKLAVTSILVLFVVSMNVATGFQSSEAIRGSPSPSPEIWEDSVDFMQNEAPEGSVVLSWWDYGYLFQTLGRTGSVADGGNFGYYTSSGEKINFPLAEYLNGTVENDTEFIDKHSADYIWLDHTMIGKFSAVSQIANRDNSQFESIIGIETNNLRQSLSRDGNQTVATFQGRLGRSRASMFVPLEINNRSASIEGSPTARLSNGRSADINCVLTENGRKEFDVESDLPFCLAEDPFYSLERGLVGGSSRVLLVPKKISDSTFVKLYIQDGYGVPYAEKVAEASNGYIKMWEITE
jgi:asparagine N-glycosylation enzyme membrane subunit Stt3